MFDKLIDFIIQMGERLLFFWIVWDWEIGVRSGLGSRKALKPGVYLKVPIFQKVLTCNGQNETFPVVNNSITTKDGKTITVSAVVGYRIDDPIKWLTENNDAETNLHDIAWGVIGENLADSDWEEIKRKPIRTTIKNKIKDDSKHIGCVIDFVRFGVIVQTRSITLFNDTRKQQDKYKTDGQSS